MNDSFLNNIEKEIELLDEELSSIGILTENENNCNSSDIQHDEEEKMEILNEEKVTLKDKENDDEILVIKDKLCLLRKSLVFKKQTVGIQCDENKINSNDNFVVFKSEKHKDAFFDPLVSPIKSDENNENEVFREHLAATKIQKQWKQYQLKRILIDTFNRHLIESQSNKLPFAISDIIASTTHHIVDHAEKLFSAKHENTKNQNIYNYNYAQLHFLGSPALDWSAVYSMIESVVLRNLLYYKNNQIVRKILDTQRILDDMLLSNASYSNADKQLIDQLTSQLIQLKIKLYESCQTTNDCNISPLRLFPENINIFRGKQSRSTQQSPSKSIEHSNNDKDNISKHSTPSKPEFNEIRTQLSLLRKSFSRRRSNPKKYIDNESPSNFNQQRPMTAPSESINNPLPKKPFLRRKKPKLNKLNVPQKVDWSHVKSKTVSRLNGEIRAYRTANNQRTHYKQNKINWKQRAISRVDCNWNKRRKIIKRKKKKINKFAESHSHSNHIEKSHKRCIPKPNKHFIPKSKNKHNDDEYLYYLKEGNKIGKISRHSANAQLHDGSGPMILRTKQKQNDYKYEIQLNSHNEMIDIDDVDDDNQYDTNYEENQYEYDEDTNYDDNDNDHQLKELQQTFAAIEQAMKQRRLQKLA